MTAPFPHHYRIAQARTAASRARITAGDRPPLAGGPPPEFGGDAEAWTPEHLLLSAIGLCLLTTFDALAARSPLEVLDWRAETAAVLDRTPVGLSFTSITVDVELTVASGDADRARALLDRAQGQCLVSNALRVPVAVRARVVEAPAAAA